MTLGEHQEAFAQDFVRLLLRAWELGYQVRIGEVYRTPEQQAIYIQTGRSKTMRSMHINKTAADVHFFKNGKLCYPKELGEYWESLDERNEWGGNWRSFKDAPHFQRTV
jgi:hypothetical protein